MQVFERGEAEAETVGKDWGVEITHRYFGELLL